MKITKKIKRRIFYEVIWWGAESRIPSYKNTTKSTERKKNQNHKSHTQKNWRHIMTNKKEVAQEILYSYMDVEKDLSQPKILIHTFKVLIHQLQYDRSDWRDLVNHMIIDVRDILDVCEELEKL